MCHIICVTTLPPINFNKTRVVSLMLRSEEHMEEITELEEIYKTSEDGITWKTVRKVTTITPSGTSERVEIIRGTSIFVHVAPVQLCACFSMFLC